MAASRQVHAGESRLQPCIHAAAGLRILHTICLLHAWLQLLLQFDAAGLVYNDALWKGCCLSYCLVNQERWLEEGAEYWTPQPSTTGSLDEKGAADKGERGQRYKKYMPFGDGMRACVGQSLAKMNYTAATALLLSHFTFRLADWVRDCTHSSCFQCRVLAGTCHSSRHEKCLLLAISNSHGPFNKSNLGEFLVHAMHARLEEGFMWFRWAGQRECWLRRWRASRWRNATACGCMQSPDLWLLE